MDLLIQHDQLAHDVIAAAAVASVVSEVAATYLGQARDGRRRIFGSLFEAVLLTRRRDAEARDRWTKQIMVAAIFVGFITAYTLTADVPSTRTLANNWWTLGVGVGFVLFGIAVRSWAVWTLGRYFRREVTVEAGQRVIRGGPYRWVRHPAYAGNLLMYGGLGLAFGSWLGAGVLVTLLFIGTLPRVHVEEQTLEQAFGSEYGDYKRATARLIPRVW